MADEFWNKVYDKLVDNYELLKLICTDTSNQDLLSWVNPNHELKIRCNRYLKLGVVFNREGLIDEIISYSKKNNPLRRIILLTWVNKNQASMEFYNLAGNSKSIERLKNGDFGNILKIKILSKIDPRQGSDKLYKDILEEAEKKNISEPPKQEINEPITISNAELEALSQSKDIINGPDTNNGAYSGDFNEVVYNELAKIKAALEVLENVNKDLKKENKELRTEQNKRIEEITNFSIKLEKKVNEAKELSVELKKEKELNSSLSSQLTYAKEELKAKPVPTISESEINDLRHKLDEALMDNTKLSQALSNREASIDRIKAENEELLSKVRLATDQSNIISNLQKKLADLQSKNSSKTKNVAGQMITKTRYNNDFVEKAGKKCWLFVAVTGEVYYLDLESVPKNLAVPEEYLLITFDDNKLIGIQSLEVDRKEVLGTIRKEEDKAVLVCEDGRFPVYLDVTEKWFDRPARGVWLPELDNRNSGIYKLDVLPDNAKLNKNQPKSSKKALEKANKKDENIKFKGQKIIIFGGDRVGLEYEKALSNVGLSATWFSGFSLLTEISLGTGKPDLIIVVTKQISHALLRELNSYAEKKSIPIAYSTRRGITSVLEVISKFFR